MSRSFLYLGFNKAFISYIVTTFLTATQSNRMTFEYVDAEVEEDDDVEEVVEVLDLLGIAKLFSKFVAIGEGRINLPIQKRLQPFVSSILILSV
jgi:hypothetical protein